MSQSPVSTTNRVILYTPYFSAQSPSRQYELDECLRKNVANSLISKIILFIDDDAIPVVQSEKIIVRNIDSRPTYADWVRATLDYDFGGISVLANSDIYFDATLEKLSQCLDQHNSFVALSRWEHQSAGLTAHPNPHWSQDTWAISSDSHVSSSLLAKLDFELGVPRCDNKVAYLFALHGWNIKNPVKIIRSVHLHNTEERSYEKTGDFRILGGVAYVHPSESLEAESDLSFDIWSMNTRHVIKVDLNKSLESWTHASAMLVEEENNLEAPIEPATKLGKLEILKKGDLELSDHDLKIYSYKHVLLICEGVDPQNWFIIEKDEIDSAELPQLKSLFPAALRLDNREIRDEPLSNDDVQFWQYPCWTEKQAFLNHAEMPDGRNVDRDNKVIHQYIGLPWATYIDKKHVPADVVGQYRILIRKSASIARFFGYQLKIHSACQQIHWPRLMDTFEDLGVTDLYLSHCENNTAAELKDRDSKIVVHPWTLYAVNVAHQDRTDGLQIGKPISERSCLTSFIGAHMDHYRSDVRMRIYEGVQCLDLPNVVIDLGNEWHFNNIVYKEQVASQSLDQQEVANEISATHRYNQLLSDSKFALCPEGAGPNTLRLWEAIAVGCIPVLFDKELLFPDIISEELVKLCVFWQSDTIGAEFYQMLNAFPEGELQRRSDSLIKLYERAEQITCF